MNIHINPKFKSLIPPLSEDEYKGLEESILEWGCVEPIKTWIERTPMFDEPQQDFAEEIFPEPPMIETEYIIDGHNRYEICTRHGISFKTMSMDLDSEDDVLVWIIDNQLARRNIDKWTKFDLNKAREEIVARQAKERHGYRSDISDDFKEKFPESGTQTRDIMGKSIGVSGKTYDKMKVIDKEGSPEIKKMVRDGDISIDKAYLTTKGITDKSPQKNQKEIIEKADAEREEFKNSKAVSFGDIEKDKKNRGILARNLYSRCLRMGTNISEIAIIEKETNISIEEMKKELSSSEIESLRQKIKWWINTLSQIERRL